MNFNPNNQNTLLTKKVTALYEAMQKAGDSGLAFIVVDSLNSLANYARFLAEQEILIQQARITMDAASYRIFITASILPVPVCSKTRLPMLLYSTGCARNTTQTRLLEMWQTQLKPK